MYECFTDAAKEVMKDANAAAQRLQHEYIGTEHIVIGLTGVPSSKELLCSLGIVTDQVEEYINRIVHSGTDGIVLAKLPSTPRARKIIEYAVEEARSLQLKHVDVEHLLVGVLREGEGLGAEALTSFGLTLEKARAAAARLSRPSSADDEEIANLRPQLDQLRDTVGVTSYAEALEAATQLCQMTKIAVEAMRYFDDRYTQKEAK
jgi:ATP-dependent Clp protease ATP-binding subunit ClpC